MNKKKSVILLVCLVVLLGAVNAAWILNYTATITTNVISNERTFSFDEFEDTLNLDTTNGPNSTMTNWSIDDLDEDLNVTFEISTHKTNLTSEEECISYKEDCRVITTYIYANGTRNVLTLTEGSSVNGEANLILFEDDLNTIEYRIECAENSCPQEIESEIEITEFTNYYPEE